MRTRLSVFALAPMGAAFLVTAVAVQAAEPETRKVEIAGASGTYTVERWKKDWPGCAFQDGIKEGHVSVAERRGENRLRVDFAVGGIGPEKGGAGWRWPVGTREHAQLRYTVRFSRGFEWVKGGKLPGLCGGPDNVSGGRPANGTNGFSARLMWRKEGRGEAYVYHKNQPQNYGESFPFPADFRFPEDTDVQVRMEVRMNTPGKRDGVLRVWVAAGNEGGNGVAEKLVVERTDMEWRTVATFGVDSLYFETFHGGNDASWAPQKPCWAEFGGMRVEG